MIKGIDTAPYMHTHAHAHIVHRNIAQASSHTYSHCIDNTLLVLVHVYVGLKEVEEQLRSMNIPMYLTRGDPVANITAFTLEHRCDGCIRILFYLNAHVIAFNKGTYTALIITDTNDNKTQSCCSSR